jgi:flagellin
MKIQTNTAANYALGYTRANSAATERSIQKLSSGFRINRAGDDAAGLAIANKLRADGRSLSQAQKNASQASAMVQVMDGATQTIASILDRMKELATQANSDNVGDQRDKLNTEFGNLKSEIQRIVDTTKYQGKSLINGDFGNSVETDVSVSTVLDAGTGVNGVTLNGAKADVYTFTDNGDGTITIEDSTATVTQTVSGAAAGATVTFDKLGISLELGAGYVAGTTDASGDLEVLQGAAGGSFMVSSSGSYSGADRIDVTNVNLNTGAGGLNITGDITTLGNAATMLGTLDTAINTINTALGNIGAAQSRLDVAGANVATMYQNTLAAESTVRDADMAYEMTQFTKNNILQQAAQSMLAQANQNPQGILQLLRG